MAPPLEATGTAYLGTQPLLAGYLFLIAIAAFAGGVSVSFLTLGHRRLQVFLSFTGGVLLGVGTAPHDTARISRTRQSH